MTAKNALKNAARTRQATIGGSYAAHKRVLVSPPPPPRWRCDVCGKHIEDRDGFVTVIDPKFDNDLQRKPRRRARGVTQLPNALEVIEAERLRRVQFDAYHDSCAPVFDYSSPYYIEVEEASTLDAWCSWVKHVGKKTWMESRDVVNMLEFWFENRGRSLRG